MRIILLFILLFSSISYANEFEFKDKYGKTNYTIDKNGIIKDRKGNHVSYITKDGYLKNNKGKKIGELNVRKY